MIFMIKKRILLCIMLFFLLIFSLTVLNAVDMNESIHDTNKIVQKENNGKNINKHHYIDKKFDSSKTIILNSSSFDEYVETGKFNERVSDGDTVDIQGKLDGNRFVLNVNKPVNIISSTGDAWIHYNTNPSTQTKDYFMVSCDGANVSDLSFYNTRISINSRNTIINNITCLVQQGVGNGLGSFRLESASNITVSNSTFTNQGNGHSVVVLAGATNCTIENNIIEGIDGSGNLLYATSYGANEGNYGIVIRNNTIRTKNIPSTSIICWGLVLQGTGFLIENNYIDTNYPVEAQWSDSSYGVETQVNGVIFNNNTIVRNSANLNFPAIISNNRFMGGANINNGHAFNNTFNDASIGSNTIFENNTARNIYINKDNNTINNNNARNVVINGNNNTLENNCVYSDGYYAVTVTGINNSLINNNLTGDNGRGDKAINNTTEIVSINNRDDIVRVFYLNDANWNNTFTRAGTASFPISGVIKDNDVLIFETRVGPILNRNSIPSSYTVTLVNLRNFRWNIPCNIRIINSSYITTSTSENIGFNGAHFKEITNCNFFIISSRDEFNDIEFTNSTLIIYQQIPNYIPIYPVNNTFLLAGGTAIVNPLNSEGYLTGDVLAGSRLMIYNYTNTSIYFDRKLDIFPSKDAENLTTNVNFVSGCEGTTVTGIRFNQNVTVDGNVIFKNCIFNGEVNITGSSAEFEGCIFNGKVNLDSAVDILFNNNTFINDDVPLSIIESRKVTIENNTINTTAENTIVFDNISKSNTVRNNKLTANTLIGDDSIIKGSSNVEDNGPEYKTQVFVESDTINVNDVNQVNITVNNKFNDTPVDKGYVDVYLDGIYQGSATLENGKALINITPNKTVRSGKNVPLRVWYYDGIRYSNSDKTIGVTVKRTSVNITLNDFETKLNENTTIEASYKTENNANIESGNVMFTVGKKTYYASIIDGIARLNTLVTEEWVDAGKLTITLLADYEGATTSIKLEVEPGDVLVDSNIDVEAVNAEISMNLTNILNENITDGTITVTTSNGTILAQEEVTNGVFNKNVTIPYGYKDDYLVASYTDSYYYKDFEITLEYTRINNSTVTIDEESIVLGDTTQITAKLATEEGITVDGGEVIFRVNGKTLRDNDGNVIYVEVKDGIATLENINITREWLKPDTYIQAVYSGNEEFEPFVTQKTNVTVTKPEATVTITSKLEAKAGDNITLSASITCNHKAINSGRVVFKLNGKTLKGEDGKALYVDVKDGVATTNYLLPVKTKAKTYTLTAVFTDTNYNRSEAEADFVVTS